MANIPLKTIKFPGLDDTYTVPQVDNTLSVTGAAADAKKTGDEISELNERLTEQFEYKIKAFDDYSLYGTQGFGVGNTIVSTRIIPAGSFVYGVKFHANVSTTSYNTWLYIIDKATKKVLAKKSIHTRDEWKTAPFNFYCPTDCVFGFCGGSIYRRAEYAASPDKNKGNFVFSNGLLIGSSAFPEVGDIITITTTEADIVFSLPVEILIAENSITAEANNEIITICANELNVRNTVFKELSFNGVALLNKATETMRGVTYTWSGDTCTIAGTATGGKSQYNLFISNNSFPDWLKPGTTYYIDISATAVFFRVYAYINGAIVNVADSRTTPIFFTFPSNASGCIITFEVNNGDTVNESITPKILRADFNTEITTRTIYDHPAIISFIDDDTGRYAPSFWGDVMTQTGIRMGFACITGMMSGQVAPSQDTYVQMTETELRTLYNNGNEVYSHSWSHPAFYESTPERIEEECMKSKIWLDNNGFSRTSDIIVYPGGLGANKPAEYAVVRQFYKYGIDTFGGVSDEPIVNPYQIKRINADTGTLAELKGYVDEAVTKKRQLVFMNHAYQLNLDLTNQKQKILDLIDYIQSQNAIILPFGEAVHRIYGWSR